MVALKRCSAAGAALLLALATACSPSGEARTDEQSSNDTIKDASSERRLLSLAPSTTEILYALGAGNDVIGVTDYCTFPPEAAAKPKFGGFHNPNVEAMLAARPTMAFHATGARGLEDQLRAAGIEVVSVPSDRLSDVAGGLRIAGRALGLDETAGREATSFERAIDELRAACAQQPRVRVLIVLSRTPGPVRQVFSVGPETFIDDLLQLVGAENALADSPAPYPQPSLEELIARPPDVIVEESSRTAPDEIAQARAEWSSALGPNAAKVRVEVYHDPHLSIPGPGILASARRLAVVVHPNLVLPASGS